MIEPTIYAPRSLWRLPLYATIIEVVVFVPLATLHPDVSLVLDIFVVATLLVIISTVLIVWMIGEARQIPPILATLAILWVIPVSLFFYNRDHPFELHESVRWLVSSHQYKSQVLAQPASTDGELKHIEWDAAGFAGVANDTVFLVFDPANSLSGAAERRQPGKIGGIPCQFRFVQRLESQWYAVLFYTDQSWNQCD